ncbi:MAG: homocysteine S-methyltransferase family protein [Fimbriimonadaceae bacterium]|nr:homocysteine S-methyltransferase family protein [Fimbriimonadaceae bacterium]
MPGPGVGDVNLNGLKVLDGGMGTMLMERGLPPGTPSCLWVLDHPDAVADVHRGYADAGAMALTTNTFGANRWQLALHGREGELAEVNRLAVEIARTAAPGLPILGDIGPSGEVLAPTGELEPEELAAGVRSQAEALASAGVDGFLVETFSDPAEAAATVAELVPFRRPILATFTFQKAGDRLVTAWGTEVAAACRAVIAAGAHAVGANCGTDLTLEDYSRLALLFCGVAPERVIVLQPNAGPPDPTGGHRLDANLFAAWARSLPEGILVGGCCGTTPQHIRAMSEVRSR